MFTDRADAGRRLARRLESFRGREAVVLGLPRGGVPVAYEVATRLDLPLDVIVVRKLGVPFQAELAMGAIGEGGVRVLNSSVLAQARVSEEELDAVEARERAELEERVARFRRGRARMDLRGRTALIVDDGIATGSTARAACVVARHLGASRVVLAVPVAPADSLREITEADEVVCLSMPEPFLAVGYHYRDFAPTSDDEVTGLLGGAAGRAGLGDGAGTGDTDSDVQIPAPGGTLLGGHLSLPARSRGVVVFAHGSGSSRHSPRNVFVADVLRRAGLGTLLLDLLTREEEVDRARVFDISLLAERLRAVTEWLGAHPVAARCRIGYFGASTGAGAALWAAAEAGSDVAAVVSRGGRPDLAGPHLPAVNAPTLLIVGSLDTVVLGLNRDAQRQLRCPHRLAIVEGATHLFEEPGALEQVAELARDWFTRYLLGAEDDPPVAH